FVLPFSPLLVDHVGGSTETVQPNLAENGSWVPGFVGRHVSRHIPYRTICVGLRTPTHPLLQSDLFFRVRSNFLRFFGRSQVGRVRSLAPVPMVDGRWCPVGLRLVW